MEGSREEKLQDLKRLDYKMEGKWKKTAIFFIVLSVILLLSSLFFISQADKRVGEYNLLLSVCEYQNSILNNYEPYLFDWEEISFPELFGMNKEEMFEKYTTPTK